MKTVSIYCRSFIVFRYSPTSATMDPLPALITPAPEPPHAILRERNISGSLIPGLNYVEGWSSIGSMLLH